MRMIKPLILATVLALFLGCKNNENQEITLSSDQECVVVGNIKGIRNGIIEFQDEYDGFKVVASGEIRNRRFMIRTDVSQPTHVFAYSDKDNQLRDFFLEPGIVHIAGSKENDLFSGATGTPSNDYWQAFRKEEHIAARDDLDALYHRYYENAPTDIVRLRLLAYIMINEWSSPYKLELMQALDPGVLSMPGARRMLDIYTRRAKVEPNGENVYIDIEQPDPEGKVVSLKEIVEKPGNRYVLIDFWATWCSSCREQMPLVKEAYERYHDKGFDIYAVSSDNGERFMARWRQYIVDNELPWTNVCNNEEHSQAYSDYAVDAIGLPDNVLIDCSDGKIVDRSIRGVDLAARLSELLD